LVLDGYPAVMRQPIRSELFHPAPTPAEASALGGVSGPPGVRRAAGLVQARGPASGIPRRSTGRW